MRRSCRSCCSRWASTPGAPRSADLDPRISRCMSRCRRSTGESSARAISFKAASARDAQTEFAAVAHRPLADRVDFAAELARRWASLRRKPPSDKRLACVLPDYPARGGRTGYAVGLDTPASAVAIGETLRAAGYDVASGLDAPSLIAALAARAARGGADVGRIRGRARFDSGGLPAILVRRMGRAPPMTAT